MANQLAMKAGKRYMNKKFKMEDSGDTYKWIHINERGKKTMLKKDENYFHHELGIPKHDAQVLAKVMKRARRLDGFKVGGLRIGVASAVELIPAIGDIIAGLLSMSIIKTAGTVSGGLDQGYRNKMVRNVIMEVAIGLVPVLGDFIDFFFQANTKNAKLLEDMLTARVMELEELGKAGHALEDDDAHTNGRTNGHTNGHSHYRKARPAAIEERHTATNGHRNERSRTRTPPRYDDRHAGVHERMQSKTHHGSTKSTHTSEDTRGGGWLDRLQSRGNRTEGGQNGGHRRVIDEDVAPARPPRPAGHQQIGSF